MFFTSKKNLVAIDVGSSSIKLAEIESTSRGPVLKKFSMVPLNNGAVVGGEIMEFGSVSSAIDTLLSAAKSKRKNAVTGMWGASVIVKKISMPKMDAKLVGEQIRWEAEQYVPFDINEVSLDYHILKSRDQGAESMEVLLVAAKQEYIFRYIECLEVAKLKATIIDVSDFALANCFEANYGVFDQPVALLDIGAGATNFVVIDRGEVVFCRDVAVGGATVTSEIAKTMSVSFEEAESLKASAALGQEAPSEVLSCISSANELLVEEIKSTFEFFAATNAVNNIKDLYVCGGGMYTPGLPEAIANATGLAFQQLDPFHRVAFDAKALSPQYIDQIRAGCAVAVGLALRQAGDRK
jgi:type IV pilus assembly protein PilM